MRPKVQTPTTATSSWLQRFIRECHSWLPLGSTPGMDAIRHIREELETLDLERDLLLRPEELRRACETRARQDDRHGEGPPPICFLPVYESPAVEIVIFCLPPGSALPLHDHKGMAVLAKLIFGSLRVQLISVLPRPEGGGGGGGEAIPQQVERGRLSGGSEEVSSRESECAGLPCSLLYDGVLQSPTTLLPTHGPGTSSGTTRGGWQRTAGQQEEEEASSSMADGLGLPTGMTAEGCQTRVSPRRHQEQQQQEEEGQQPRGATARSATSTASTACTVCRPPPNSRVLEGLLPTTEFPTTAILALPTIGNVHRLAACDTYTAFLDVLTPPYDQEARRCGFFRLARDADDCLTLVPEHEEPSLCFCGLEGLLPSHFPASTGPAEAADRPS
eukprot:GHVU01124154.1.p1 GENE.GHVU01124154.1~~GHVU01124154.1.p1  ORF type:complete len:389 (+),score=70.06 GHVU01124154.1:1974-3140(+)